MQCNGLYSTATLALLMSVSTSGSRRCSVRPSVWSIRALRGLCFALSTERFALSRPPALVHARQAGAGGAARDGARRWGTRHVGMCEPVCGAARGGGVFM